MQAIPPEFAIIEYLQQDQEHRSGQLPRLNLTDRIGTPPHKAALFTALPDIISIKSPPAADSNLSGLQMNHQ